MSIKEVAQKYKRLFRSERFQEKWKQFTLPGFEGVAIYDVIYKFKEEVKNDDISIRASSISFYFILALIPSIIFFFSLIPYIPIDRFDEKVLKSISVILPQDVFFIFKNTIKDTVSRQHGGILVQIILPVSGIDIPVIECRHKNENHADSRQSRFPDMLNVCLQN